MPVTVTPVRPAGRRRRLGGAGPGVRVRVIQILNDSELPVKPENPSEAHQGEILCISMSWSLLDAKSNP